jgi:hypothetical protein
VNSTIPSARPLSDPAALPAPPAIPPLLLRIVLPLVVAAFVLGLVFAWLFPAPAGAARTVPAARFTDITAESGIRFVHNGGGPDSPTTLGGAVAVLDYDCDGRPDLFFVNGTAWPWEENGPWTRASACALYHNDGRGHFTDVSRTAGLDLVLQGMSAAVGDYDNDGWPDIFVTGVGECRLLHNQHDGTFADVTAEAGVGGDDNAWSMGATWIDIDGDGRLDLVVAHYARWPREVGLAESFGIAAMGRSYGAPTGFMGAFPSVYRNLGHGRFALVPDSAGLRPLDAQTGLPAAKALAVAPLDVDGDGRLDLLFTYHTGENQFYLNQGDGTFRRWTGGMGDRHEGATADLAAASSLPFAAAVSRDESLAAIAALAAADAASRDESRARLGGRLGAALLDYDLDGRLDAFSGNGRSEPDLNKFEATRNFAATPRLLWNRGNDWVRAPRPEAEAGAWARPVTARGVAAVDVDGDGDMDVVIVQNNGPAVVLRNDQRGNPPWLRLVLTATRTQPDAGGARVEVHTPRRVFVRTLAPAMGFMAQSEAGLTFGLGEDARVRKIVIRWPSGRRQELRPDALDQTLVIREP